MPRSSTSDWRRHFLAVAVAGVWLPLLRLPGDAASGVASVGVHGRRKLQDRVLAGVAVDDVKGGVGVLIRQPLRLRRLHPGRRRLVRGHRLLRHLRPDDQLVPGIRLARHQRLLRCRFLHRHSIQVSGL